MNTALLKTELESHLSSNILLLLLTQFQPAKGFVSFLFLEESLRSLGLTCELHPCCFLKLGKVKGEEQGLQMFFPLGAVVPWFLELVVEEVYPCSCQLVWVYLY